MHPIVLRWGTYSLYWYSVLAWLGILSAVAYALWRGQRSGYREVQILDGALWALVGGLSGARAAYVIPNWADYAARPETVLSFWGGGLVFQGGLLGGILALFLYSLYVRPFTSCSMGSSFARLADLAAPAMALAQSFGWAGALLHGANYGIVVRSPFSLWLPDLYGVYGPRFPTQALAVLLSLVLFFGLHRLSKFRLRPGMAALIYLFGNGLGHFLLDFSRADEAAYIGHLRVTQWAELLEAAVACALLLYMWRLALRGRMSRRTTEAREG
jgi:phosphatidylglycerol:prolipoprotein diacylglycerol transferase